MKVEVGRLIRRLLGSSQPPTPSLMDQVDSVVKATESTPRRKPVTSLPKVDKSQVSGLLGRDRISRIAIFTMEYIDWQLERLPDEDVDLFEFAEFYLDNTPEETFALVQWMNAHPEETAIFLETVWHRGPGIKESWTEPYLELARNDDLNSLELPTNES